MPKLLITGIAGFFGNHLARFFKEKGFDVFGIDNYVDSFKDMLPSDIRCYEGDVADKKFVDEIFFIEKPDYVIHLAAMASESGSHYLRRLTCNTNCTGTTNIITACVNFDIRKIIITSSMAAMGAIQPPFKENDIPLPDDLYGASKYFNELDVKFANKQFGLRYSIIRPHNIIGIYQNIWSKTRNVIGIWIRQAMNGEDLTIYGSGECKRAFSHVKFYLEPIFKLLEEYDGEIFNLGSDKVWTILEASKIVQKVSQKYGFNPNLKFLERRNEVLEAYSDHSKSKRLLDFKDETNLEETVDEMFAWAITQPKRLVQEPKMEITKNLYSFWR